MPNLKSPVALQPSDFKDSLQLQGSKEQVESTLAQVKKWLAQEDMPKLDVPLLSRLSLFGLRTPEDVRIFLETPAGEAVVKAWLDDMLVEIAALENAEFEQRELLHHKKLLAVYLILGLLYKHNAHAHELIDQTIAELSKKLHSETKPVAPEPTGVESVRDFNTHTNPVEHIEAMLHNKIAESKALESKLAAMKPLHQAIEAKYATLESHLEKAHQLFANLQAPEPNASSAKEPDLTAKMEALIMKLKELITTNTTEVTAALENNQETKARALMNKGNALNLQVAALREMLSVREGKSIWYNSQHKPTESFSEAAYVLPAGTKIVENEGKHYLLQAHQTLEGMSAEDIHTAEMRFKNLKPAETMSIKQLVQHNHRLENAPREALSARSDQLQQELLLLAQQLTTLQESRSKAELSLRPTPASAPALKMTPIDPSATPTPSPQPRPGSKINKELVESYEHVIRLMSNDPSAMRRLQEGFTRANPSMLLKQQLNELKPGMPIPQATMNNMLAMPNVGQTLLGIKNPDVEKGTSPSPSPFRTRPRGMV